MRPGNNGLRPARPTGKPSSWPAREWGTARAGLRQRGLRLEADVAVLDWLATHGYHANCGARRHGGASGGGHGPPALRAQLHAALRIQVVLGDRQLVEGFVGDVLLKHIEDKTFFDGLPHGIDVEGSWAPVLSGATE